MFDESQLRSGMQLPKAHLIHKGPDQEEAAAGAAQQILRGQRVGQRFRVQPFALVGDGNNQFLSVVLKTGRDPLGRVVLVAMQYRVDGGLARRHGHMEAIVLVQTGFRGQLARGRLHLGDALHGGTQRQRQPPGLRYASRIRIRLFRRKTGAPPPRATQQHYRKFQGLKGLCQAGRVFQTNLDTCLPEGHAVL